MSQYKEWDFQLWNVRTGQYVNDSTGVAVVLSAGTPDYVTVKADQNGTSLSQPITMSAGRIRFFTAKSVSTVDISVLTASGFSAFLSGRSASDHKINIYPEVRQQLLVVPYQAVSDTTVTSTGFNLVNSMLLKDIHVKATNLGTNVTNATLDVGILGSTTLLLAGQPIITTGLQEPQAITDFVEAALVYYGTAFAKVNVGTATTEDGSITMKSYHVTTTGALVYQHNVTTGSIGRGYILIDYTVIPV